MSNVCGVCTSLKLSLGAGPALPCPSMCIKVSTTGTTGTTAFAVRAVSKQSLMTSIDGKGRTPSCTPTTPSASSGIMARPFLTEWKRVSPPSATAYAAVKW